MLNQCSVIGHMGADPEIRSFSNGGKIANLRLAVTEKWKDKTTGERKERTEWIPVTISGDGLVGVVERFLHKGSKVFVQGKFTTRKYQDKDGNDRYSTEIVVAGIGGQLVMLDGPKGDGGQRQESRSEKPPFNDDLDDDVPF